MCSPADVMLINAAGQCKNCCDISVNDSRSHGWILLFSKQSRMNTIKWCKLDATSSAPVKNTTFGRNHGFTTQTCAWTQTHATESCPIWPFTVNAYTLNIDTVYWKPHTNECCSHFWDRKPLRVSDAFRLSFESLFPIKPNPGRRKEHHLTGFTLLKVSEMFPRSFSHCIYCQLIHSLADCLNLSDCISCRSMLMTALNLTKHRKPNASVFTLQRDHDITDRRRGYVNHISINLCSCIYLINIQ